MGDSEATDGGKNAAKLSEFVGFQNKVDEANMKLFEEQKQEQQKQHDMLEKILGMLSSKDAGADEPKLPKKRKRTAAIEEESSASQSGSRRENDENIDISLSEQDKIPEV